LLAAVFFGSYFVKGAIGMGAMSPAILFGTMLVGPHHAILLGAITNAASHLQFLPQGMRDGDWRVARQVMLGNFAGSVLGIWIFGQVSSAWLTFLLGLTLGAVLITDMTNALERLSRRIDLRASSFVVPLSAISGVISGVTGAGGLFVIAIYVKHVCPTPRTYRRTVILLAMLVVGWRTVVLVATGFIDRELVMEGALMLPAIVLGGIAGTWVYRKLTVTGFFMFFQLVILFGAVNLLWRGLKDLL
jgi:hypothetical protein